MKLHIFRLSGHDFVHYRKIEIGANDRAVYQQSISCFIVYANFDWFLINLLTLCEDEKVIELINEYFDNVYKKIDEMNIIQKETEIQTQRMKEIEEKFLEYKKHFKVTTGYSFDGYKVEKYIGILSGEVVLGTGFISEYAASFSDLFGVRSNAFADKMMSAKQGALQKLMKNALVAGANAIIGVDFDYITFNNNILGVSANGTAVVIQKEER